MKIIFRSLLLLCAVAELATAQVPLAEAFGRDNCTVSNSPFYPIQALLNDHLFAKGSVSQAFEPDPRSGLVDMPAARDIYLAIRTDAPGPAGDECAGQGGTGLPLDPCDGSTQMKFDAILRAQPESTAIHLGGGIFFTHGVYGWSLLRGMKILGRGIDRTTLKQVFVPLTDGFNFGVISGRDSSGPDGTDGDNAEIAALTIDCNYDALQPLTVAAIGHDTINASIYGVVARSGLIRNVRVIHSGGNLETFCIALAAQGPHSNVPAARYSHAPLRSEIRDCVVESPSAIHQALTAITVFAGFFEAPFDGSSTDLIPYGGIGLIRNCTVDGGPYGVTAAPKIIIAYQGAGFNSLLIEHCYARNAVHGFYHDTGPQRHLEIAHCIFDGVSIGIRHFGGARQEASDGHYHHNTIISFDSGISLCSANHTTVDYNTLWPVAGATINPSTSFIFQQFNSDLTVDLEKNVYRHNRVHENFCHAQLLRGNPQLYRNRYFGGAAIDELPDNASDVWPPPSGAAVAELERR